MEGVGYENARFWNLVIMLTEIKHLNKNNFIALVKPEKTLNDENYFCSSFWLITSLHNLASHKVHEYFNLNPSQF